MAFDIRPTDDDSPIAAQRDGSAAALKDDFIVCSQPNSPAIHVGFDEWRHRCARSRVACRRSSGIARLRRRRLDEADDERSRTITVLEEHDGLPPPNNRGLQLVARCGHCQSGTNDPSVGELNLGRVIGPQGDNRGDVSGGRVVDFLTSADGLTV